jgi:group I intron endonuclease
MKQSGIYKITINDKVYVGLSVDIVKRIMCHKSLLRNNRHSNNHLQSAYNKYKSFDWEVLEEGKEWIEEKEIMWIDKLDAYKNGFNQNDGGAGNNHTEESKRKISAAMSGKNNPMYGKDWRVGKTKEELARISAIRAEISRNHPVKQSTIEKLRILNAAEKNPLWCGVSTEEMIEKVLEHQSVIKAAEEIGINKNTIRCRLTKAGYDFVYDGHKFSSKTKITNIVRVR